MRKKLLVRLIRQVHTTHTLTEPDWDNSDGEYPSSEPMDSITELVPADDLEMDLPT
jgi:hypothetical protein